MKKWGKALVAACAVSVAGFMGAGNAYADAYTVKIDDPDFYAALKDCVQNGMSYDEWVAAKDASTHDVQAKKDFLNNTYYCSGFNTATFSDGDTSIVFEDELDVDAVDIIYMPHRGLKNVDDVNKFPYAEVNFSHNEIEYLNLDSARDVTIKGNPLKKVPKIYSGILDIAVEEMGYQYGIVIFSSLITGLAINDEYSGSEYELPEIISEIKKGFDDIGLISDAASESESPEFDPEFSGYTNALKNYYSVDNWLYLENAILSEDGKKLIAIDPTKDMVISFRQSWDNMFENSPYLNPCLYPSFDHLGYCFDGQPSDLTDKKVFVMSLHDSDEYGDVITITLKSKNSATPENPDSSDNVMDYVLGLTAMAPLFGIAVVAKNYC